MKGSTPSTAFAVWIPLLQGDRIKERGKRRSKFFIPTTIGLIEVIANNSYEAARAASQYPEVSLIKCVTKEEAETIAAFYKTNETIVQPILMNISMENQND